MSDRADDDEERKRWLWTARDAVDADAVCLISDEDEVRFVNSSLQSRLQLNDVTFRAATDGGRRDDAVADDFAGNPSRQGAPGAFSCE
jgi:hypothetical protein